MSTDHHKESIWTKYIFSTDHKIIGLQYGITSLVWLLVGFILMMIMRYQLAYPGNPVPILGNLLGEGGIIPPEMYNSLEEFIQQERNNGLTHIVVDDNTSRIFFIKEITILMMDLQ